MGVLAPTAARWRSIAINGTIPDPPPMRSRGWEGLLPVPDEVPADRPAKLQLVPHPELADQVRRYLTVIEPLNRYRKPPLFRCGGDRIAPLGLVAIFGGESHIDVLSGPMSHPAWHVKDQVNTVAASRPARRRRRAARSVAPVPLLAPWVAVVVVAVGLPEARLVLSVSVRPRTHLALFHR